MKHGQDPDDSSHIVEIARDRLQDMGEHISSDRLGDLVLNALTPDYIFVRNTSFRDREFGLEDIKSTMRNMHADLLSLTSSTPSIAGRGVAMQTQDDLHGSKCYIRRSFGYGKGHCPKYNPNWKKTRKEGSFKWCSLHKTASHSNYECRAKGQKHPLKQQKK